MRALKENNRVHRDILCRHERLERKNSCYGYALNGLETPVITLFEVIEF